MRCREWYGWHFPELGKVITDNLAYCKTVRKIGNVKFRPIVQGLFGRLSLECILNVYIFFSLQAIAQTWLTLICPTSCLRKSKLKWNWLLRSPWEPRCRSRTSTTSCTCVIRYGPFTPCCHLSPITAGRLCWWWRLLSIVPEFNHVGLQSLPHLNHRQPQSEANAPFSQPDDPLKSIFHLFFSAGDRDHRLPCSAVRLPEESDDGHRPQPDSHGWRAGRRPAHFTRRWVSGGLLHDQTPLSNTHQALMTTTSSHFPWKQWCS